MLTKLIDLFGPPCFLIYITPSGLTGGSEAQLVAGREQLLLIFLYKLVCYDSALIGYHVTPCISWVLRDLAVGTWCFIIVPQRCLTGKYSS